MTQAQLLCMADLLDAAADKFGNHGCNDWDWPAGVPEADRMAIVRAFHDWNGDPQEFDPEWLSLPDFAAMRYFAGLCRIEAEGR